MPRSDGGSRVTGKGGSPWDDPKVPGPIRRDVRETTWFDRVLMAVLAFVAGAAVTGFGYWRFATRHSYGYRPETTLERLTGTAAREHFLLVCAVGGLVGVAVYVGWSVAYNLGDNGEKRGRRGAGSVSGAGGMGEGGEAGGEKPDRFSFLADRERGEK